MITCLTINQTSNKETRNLCIHPCTPAKPPQHAAPGQDEDLSGLGVLLGLPVQHAVGALNFWCGISGDGFFTCMFWNYDSFGREMFLIFVILMKFLLLNIRSFVVSQAVFEVG